jgi:epoxyqueuosine reductase
MTLHDVFSPILFKDLGIVDWGYTEEPRPLSFDHYEKWVERDGHGPLHYLADERKNKRADIRSFFPEFQSSLVFLFSYADQKASLDHFYKNDPDSNGLKMASYALGFEGEDYHFKLRDKLLFLSEKIKEIYPDCHFSHSLDIQPVLERDLAVRAGLGWFGKNSMFISRKKGSFLMIGSLFLSQKLTLDSRPMETDHCGSCTRCIDLCPTLAIDPETRTLDSKKCISTYTIELFKDDKVAPEGMEKAGGEIFGCDICQDVCPWNKKALSNPEKSLPPSSLMNFFLKRPIDFIISDLEKMSNREFRRVFKGSALERTGRRSLLKNIQFWKSL